MSNLFAIGLQTLAIKLGSVTGLNLAEVCRRELPRWLTICLYVLAEAAIIATDIAEVIGSAIALNLLLHIPLVAGCAITLVDVLLLLLFYRPDGSMVHLRIFEYFIMLLVLGVMICFCIQLTYIHNATAGEVMKGYLPSSAVVNGNGIYLSCGILGATVMPHVSDTRNEGSRARCTDTKASRSFWALESYNHDYGNSMSAIAFWPTLPACRWTLATNTNLRY
jgi:metal iron transporter